MLSQNHSFELLHELLLTNSAERKIIDYIVHRGLHIDNTLLIGFLTRSRTALTLIIVLHPLRHFCLFWYYWYYCLNHVSAKDSILAPLNKVPINLAVKRSPQIEPWQMPLEDQNWDINGPNKNVGYGKLRT